MSEDQFQEGEFQEVEDTLTPEQKPQTSEGIPWGAILLLFWAVVLIIFSVQNAEDTSVDLLWWTWEMPVAVLVMVTALITLVVAVIGSAIYRRRRRKQREMKAALKSAE